MLVSHAAARTQSLDALLLNDRVRLIGVHQRRADGHAHRGYCGYPCRDHGERGGRSQVDDCGGGAAWSTEARVALADTGLRRRDHVGIEGPRPSASIMQSFIWVQLIGSNYARINCLHHSSCI